MAFNVPVYETKRITFGPGILYLGVVGATPTFDVGSVKGDATLTVKRTSLDVEQGSPRTLIKQYVTKEEIRIKLTGIEWRLDQLSRVLGAGVTSVSGANELLEFGGDMEKSEHALLYRHIAVDGSTIDVMLWRVQGTGDFEIGFKTDDVHEMAYEFTALEGTTDFTNAVPAAKKKLMKILRVKA